MDYSGNLDWTKIYIDGVLEVEKSDWDINSYPETGLVFKLFATSSDFPFSGKTFKGYSS